MGKYELHPEYHDLFEYYGGNEIERFRFKGGQTIRRDSFAFEIRYDAERCGEYLVGWVRWMQTGVYGGNSIDHATDRVSGFLW
jgi:hypothetical protein